MTIKAYFGRIGALMLAAALGFFTLTRFPEYGHLTAWALVLTGSVFGIISGATSKPSRQS